MLLKEKLKKTPFALALSSGFFGFFAHCGFIKALYDAGLKPAALSGASAGALVATALASGHSPEETAKIMTSVSLGDFWDPGVGLGLLKGKKFEKLCRDFFISDFAKAKINLKLSVFNVVRWRTEVAEQGELIPMLRASCAVPLLFQPVFHGGTMYWDGGYRDKMGIAGLGAGDSVLVHYLRSKHGGFPTDHAEILRKKRPNYSLIALEKIPRLGPFKLKHGPRVIELAYEQTRRQLESSVF